MGKIYGSRRAREVAQQEEPVVEYPPLPVQLLRIIYEGQGINILRRSNSYIVLLEGSFFLADELNLAQWLLRSYGEKLDSEQFNIAITLLSERIRWEIKNFEKVALQAERDEDHYQRTGWAKSADYSFWGR